MKILHFLCFVTLLTHFNIGGLYTPCIQHSIQSPMVLILMSSDYLRGSRRSFTGPAVRTLVLVHEGFTSHVFSTSVLVPRVFTTSVVRISVFVPEGFYQSIGQNLAVSSRVCYQLCSQNLSVVQLWLYQSCFQCLIQSPMVLQLLFRTWVLVPAGFISPVIRASVLVFGVVASPVVRTSVLVTGFFPALQSALQSQSSRVVPAMNSGTILDPNGFTIHVVTILECQSLRVLQAKQSVHVCLPPRAYILCKYTSIMRKT